MTTSLSKKCRRNLAFAAAGAAACLLVAGFASPPKTAVADERGTAAVLTCEVDGWRFEYHVPTGTEALFDARHGASLVNVLSDHPDAAAACRRALERRTGAPSLGSLGARYGDTVRRLRAMGYL